MKTTGLFRIMARNETPELRTVQVRGNDSSVLNLNVVQYWNPEGTVSPWMKVTLWGIQAEKYVNLIEHNQAVYLEGDIQFEGYVTEAFDSNGQVKDINRIKPVFKKVNEFRLVNVIKTPREEEELGPTSDPVATAAATAANQTNYDDIPF